MLINSPNYTMPFRKWLRCPECEGEDTGILAYRTEIILECYDCGNVEEFELGADVPVHDLDEDAIDAAASAASSSDGDSPSASTDDD